MKLLFFFSDGIIRAIGWTLAHSLWEGIVLAGAAAAVMVVTQRSRAGLRYNLLVGLLVLFLAGVGYTFLRESQVNMQADHAMETVVSPSGKIPAVAAVGAGFNAGSFRELCTDALDACADFLNDHAATIVLIWLVLLSGKFLKVILDLRYLRQISSKGARRPARFWMERLQELTRQLKIGKPVQLLESARIQVPIVVGVFKPVILLPLGMLAQLPPAQIEAILLHELAHVYRRDYLVNLLQHLAETVFLFNPAVFWVSSLIRTERENCCDDLAIVNLNNKSDYLQALLSSAVFSQALPVCAVAFPGEKGHLLHRVRRILENRNTKTFSYMEKVSLLVCLLIFGVLALLPSARIQAQAGQTEKHPALNEIQIHDTGVPGAPQHIMIKDEKGKVYEMNRTGQKIVDLTVDNQAIAADQIKQYDWLVKYIDEEIASNMAEAKADQEQAEIDQREAMADQEQAGIDQRVVMADAVQAKLDAEQAARDHEQAKLDAEQAARDAQQAKLDAEQAQRDAEQARLDTRMSKQDKLQAERDAKQARLDAEQAARDAAQAKLDAEQAARDAAQAKLDAEQATQDAAVAKKEQELLDELTADLVSDKIIPNKSALHSFEIKETEFDVNGLKQPDAVFQKYKGKYGNRWPGASRN